MKRKNKTFCITTKKSFESIDCKYIEVTSNYPVSEKSLELLYLPLSTLL